MANKRLQKTLSLHDKCLILDKLDKGCSIRNVSQQFNIPKSTVFDIKRKRSEIRQFVSRSYQGIGKRKILRKFENPEMEKSLYNWFLRQRGKHIPVTSEILREKAKFFYEKLTGKNNFLASNGWLCKFKSRFGIRYLKICGERISSDLAAVTPFRKKFLEVVAKMNLSEDQIYNADESAAFWRVLPGNTWVHTNEKSAPGRKMSKDRITFMPCCNSSGTHKLPLLVIGKFENPRCFKNTTLPVVYKATSRGWMTRNLFKDWFKTCFVPAIKKYLAEAGKQQKALLLLDNAPSHPPEDELNDDPDFQVLYLPPNCTAVIQPMDQNLIQNIKVEYRKCLLKDIINRESRLNENLMNVLKNYNLKDAIINLNREDEDEESHESEDERKEDNSHIKIKTTDAVQSFSVCIQWAEENNVPLQDILLLKKLSEKVKQVYSKSLKQTTISDYMLHK